MSKRRHQHRSPLKTTQDIGILGVHLTVDDEVVGNSLPLSSQKQARLMQTLQTMLAHYQTSAGLPPKLFFFRYASAQLLILLSRQSQLILLCRADARLVELEIAARKVVATAHLKGALQPENPIIAALSLVHSPEPEELPPANLPTTSTPAQPNPSMIWNDATQALENIMAKVLSQAQAARLIAAAIQRKGIDTNLPCDAASLAEIGAELTAKIPSRPIRASLEKEVAEYISKLR